MADARTPLDDQMAARLAEFARACKAALRAVSLYPGGHPAIGSTLGGTWAGGGVGPRVDPLAK